MTKKCSLRMVLTALLATSVALAATPVSAGTEATTATGVVMIYAGHGTFAPGLVTTPTFQTSVTWATDEVIVASGGGVGCSFNGSSTVAETLQQGQGSGTLECHGGTISLSGPASYSRSASTSTYNGSVSGTVNGVSVSCGVSASALLVPTSALIVTTYRVYGSITLSC